MDGCCAYGSSVRVWGCDVTLPGPTDGTAAAVKIEDGNSRARTPVTVTLLALLGEPGGAAAVAQEAGVALAAAATHFAHAGADATADAQAELARSGIVFEFVEPHGS